MAWDIEKSKRLYRIANWSEGYFDISAAGHLECRPDNSGAAIDLYALAQELKQQGVNPPVLLRFEDVLKHRVESLHQAFASAIQKHSYQGGYQPVYPVKVNQQRVVVQSLIGRNHCGIGLECGTKPELIICIAESAENGIIVCNGYKDREYIRLALLAGRLGYKVYIVIEKADELELIHRESTELGLAPLLGVRVRLASLGEGNWQNTGGEKSKFGLTANELIMLMQRLADYELLGSLKLLHYHMGSQIASLEHFRRGVREACRMILELKKHGADIRTLDVGGGLAVDYEGAADKSYFSMNYSLQEYADTIVGSVRRIFAEAGATEPDLITEAGRAMTAHHSAMLIEVINTENRPDPGRGLEEYPAEHKATPLHRGLQQCITNMTIDNCERQLAEAEQLMDDMLSAFALGQIDLYQRAAADRLYLQVCNKAYGLVQQMRNIKHDTYNHLSEILADKYYCNFSIFQSIPDVWGIGQVFPIVPLHRLHEKPGHRALIKDLTCDSDGRIDRYMDAEGVDGAIWLHDKKPAEEYLLGVFLIGAYQEILGDMHNLFGDTHSVDIELQPDGRYRIINIEWGDRVADVLNIIHYDTELIKQKFSARLENSAVDENSRQQIRRALYASLEGYTYLLQLPPAETSENLFTIETGRRTHGDKH